MRGNEAKTGQADKREYFILEALRKVIAEDKGEIKVFSEKYAGLGKIETESSHLVSDTLEEKLAQLASTLEC